MRAVRWRGSAGINDFSYLSISLIIPSNNYAMAYFSVFQACQKVIYNNRLQQPLQEDFHTINDKRHTKQKLNGSQDPKRELS